MKRLILVGMLAVSACATRPSADFQSGDADAAIRKNAAAFSAAANSNNLSGVVALYGDDAMLLPPNAPAFHGKDAIGQFWGGMLAMGKVNVTLTTDDVLQSGDLAVETGHFDLTLAPSGAAPVKDNGKYVVVWRKLDGQWKIERDIFNTSMPR